MRQMLERAVLPLPHDFRLFCMPPALFLKVLLVKEIELV